MKVSVIGASGYTGGELLRLLLFHPEVELVQATSEANVGKALHRVHPNLRKLTNLKFTTSLKVEDADLMFLCLPHGISMDKMPSYMESADKIIDLSGDYRLRDKKDYVTWYGHEHSHPELLSKFVYGIPELHREEMKKAKYISSAGCLATASILGMYPIFKEGLADKNVVVDAKVGSSAAGNKSSLATHHAERTGVIRAYEPVMHRHVAEMQQELDFHTKPTISFTPHAIQAVRGISATCHIFLNKEMEEKEIWQVYRKHYGEEQFIRIVKEVSGIFRLPEPKILAGSNYCDIGFAMDSRTNRLVVISAIDNLMKGAAGQAVQAMNVQNGFKENLGLEFPGLHPV